MKRFWKPNTDDLNFMNVRVQSAKNEKWRRPETPEQGGLSAEVGCASRSSKRKQGVRSVVGIYFSI